MLSTYLEIIFLDKTLTTLLTQVAFAGLDPNVTIEFVRLELTVSDKTSSTKLTHEWFLPCMDPDVTLHLGSSPKRLFTNCARVRLY